tara:strand:- start:1112 stop:1708 length:597 start_codon:yes stop_codon:yes gene_type:complete
VNVYSLFPSLVAKIKVQHHEKLKKLLVPSLVKQYKDNPDLELPWARWANTWNINTNISGNLSFRKYIDEWMQHFNYPKINYDITYWTNIHEWYHYQEVHTHMTNNTFLSGIYYAQFDKDDRPAEFINPKDQALTYTTEVLGKKLEHPFFQKYSTDTGLTIEEGDLLLFTPDCRHFVPSSKDKHDRLRITLSFNAHKIK